MSSILPPDATAVGMQEQHVFDTARTVSYLPASTNKRVVAIIIDGIFANILGAILVLLIKMLPVNSLVKTIGEGLITYVAITLGYWVYLTYKHGATPGKKIMGLKVISDGPSPALSFRSVILRETIYRFISAIVLGLGYITVNWNEKRLTWHDRLAGTRVVQER
jgi:uncharacterized RDD family membrane protein YckC